MDYAKLYANRFLVLKKAWSRSGGNRTRIFLISAGKTGLGWRDYALFMALKDSFGGREWQAWPEEIRLRRPAALADWQKRLRQETIFWKYVQYLFFSQWERLKDYANQKEIRMIGDIPIYVAMDSADVWIGGSPVSAG